MINSKIKELTVQARNETSLYGGKLGDKEYNDRFIEMFAELIVRECIKVAEDQRRPQNLNYGPSGRFVEDLKRHFGVE